MRSQAEFDSSINTLPSHLCHSSLSAVSPQDSSRRSEGQLGSGEGGGVGRGGGTDRKRVRFRGTKGSWWDS